MKKLLAIMACLFAITFTSKAELSTAGQALRSQIVNYLKYEGYASATVDSDGDIDFKVEGRQYYIEISDYSDAFYVVIYYLINAEGENTFKVLKACDKATYSYKFLKCYRLDGGKAVKFAVPLYISNLSQFKNMFENSLSIVQSGRSKFLEEFSE